MAKEFKTLLAEMFWDDIGPRIRPDKLPETAYHYTSLEGVMGITENKSLWMTKSDFLNDSTEIIYLNEIVDICLDNLNSKLKELYGRDVKECKYYEMFLQQFDKASKDRFEDTESLLEIYVLSMSENQDSLTLWGNYAKGDGYNIGFDTDSLISDFDDEHDNFFIVYGRVIYNREEQIKLLVDSLVNTFKFIYGLKPDMNELEVELPQFFRSTLISYSIFFKNESFKAEEEFRIAATISDKATVNFRSSNGIIIPYIAPSFEKLPVKKVIIGPKNNSDIAKSGVKIYLERKNFDSNKIRVIKSNVPLRY